MTTAIVTARLALIALAGKNAKAAQETAAAHAVAELAKHIVMFGNTTATETFADAAISKPVIALAGVEQVAATEYRAALKADKKLAKNGSVLPEYKDAAELFALQRGESFALARKTAQQNAIAAREKAAAEKVEKTRLTAVAASAKTVGTAEFTAIGFADTLQTADALQRFIDAIVSGDESAVAIAARISVAHSAHVAKLTPYLGNADKPLPSITDNAKLAETTDEQESASAAHWAQQADAAAKHLAARANAGKRVSSRQRLAA